MNLLIFEEKFERANTSFKCCKNVEAIKQYNDLLDHILKEEDKEGFVNKPALGSAKNADKQSPYFKITCSTLLNRSSCYLTMNELEFALIDALKYEELVRDQNLDDIRVYLRLGSVYQGMENHQEAIWVSCVMILSFFPMQRKLSHIVIIHELIFFVVVYLIFIIACRHLKRDFKSKEQMSDCSSLC